MSKKNILPLIPLRNIVVFPKMIIPLFVGRDKSIQALEEALSRDRHIVLSCQKNENVDEPSSTDLYSVGTMVEIVQMLKLPDGTMKILVEGINRVRFSSVKNENGHFQVEQEVIESAGTINAPEDKARTLSDLFEKYVKINKKIPTETLMSIINIEEPERLSDMITSYLSITTKEKQKVLETYNIKDRTKLVISLLKAEIKTNEVEHKLDIKVQDQIEKVQKEYFLKEKIKAIKEELGDIDTDYSEDEEYKMKLDELNLSKETHSKILKEINRLDKLPNSSSEAGVIRTYIDWVLELPWDRSKTSDIDLKTVKDFLDKEHYSLEKVKERVIEYLAVNKLTKKPQTTILCLAGPPGVGKTSIASSIAKSLNREFCRIALGGVKDVAELRGHRRTYVGSLPGRIIQAVHKSNSNNPVILLDEIDKLCTEFKGDPSAALLEILDPEQNSTFSDHYLEVPFDLSKIIFIATANTTHTIEKPLLDRMEVIRISGYTDEEKLNICKKHIIPKQLLTTGIDSTHIEFNDDGLLKIINNYTREAGIRTLERYIATLCRKAAKRLLMSEPLPISTDIETINDLLGPIKFFDEHTHDKTEIGVAMGMAWTSAGGCLIPIEVAALKGRGKLTLTGQMGDVMQESAQAALTYIRSIASEYNISDDFYRKYDIHIHIPEGAVPKDGPSAGITIATAIASALSQRPVHNDITMTGEITLRGKVMPVGGIKEKVLAAFQAGIKTVILPKENFYNTDEIPDNIKKEISFVFADTLKDVLEIALV